MAGWLLLYRGEVAPHRSRLYLPQQMFACVMFGLMLATANLYSAAAALIMMSPRILGQIVRSFMCGG